MIHEKIRYYRLKHKLHQNEVAKIIDVDRTTYSAYENGVNFYPIDIMQKLAEIYKVDVGILLDDYHRFIHNNQGQNIKRIRKDLGLTQQELAEYLNIGTWVVKGAEQNKTRFSKNNYIKLLNCYHENYQTLE